MKQLYLLFLFLFFFLHADAQAVDSTDVARDTIAKVQPRQVTNGLQKLLEDNRFLNTRSTPVSVLQRVRRTDDETQKFYILAGLLFLFGILKTVFGRYFATLFRVFFNSTLRQGQLTDQLVQAKLPSLFFNIVFVLSGGLYVYFLLQNLTGVQNSMDWVLLSSCVLAFVVIYAIKFCAVKFIGWVTGYNTEADTYIFIVFLINKIIGVCLLPVIVILAFSDELITRIMLVLSVVFVGVMLLFRFIRSFSLLQHRLKITTFHFLLYIFSLEVLPLLLIYKVVELFITKKL